MATLSIWIPVLAFSQLLEAAPLNPRFTTQACSKCGTLIQKSVSVRTRICTSCGYVADHDVNAAQNILLTAGAPPSGANVVQ